MIDFSDTDGRYYIRTNGWCSVYRHWRSMQYAYMRGMIFGDIKCHRVLLGNGRYGTIDGWKDNNIRYYESLRHRINRYTRIIYKYIRRVV